eukprot:gnl/MRDRNA2_/MRDRNA2_82330_c0_seq3.p1 gnl/MRDRNA2_/MRDRNA2_82330_c0~~gnl/MRDRNA2_/MRDRNA2_82330_c0_seq3.p1  ORF type:complete len:252 (-),score=43.12 gnl/MRDRNA2_/MRDRNA2_82330_c0_seq3:518-1273(-)
MFLGKDLCSLEAEIMMCHSAEQHKAAFKIFKQMQLSLQIELASRGETENNFPAQAKEAKRQEQSQLHDGLPNKWVWLGERVESKPKEKDVVSVDALSKCSSEKLLRCVTSTPSVSPPAWVGFRQSPRASPRLPAASLTHSFQRTAGFGTIPMTTAAKSAYNGCRSREESKPKAKDVVSVDAVSGKKLLRCGMSTPSVPPRAWFGFDQSPRASLRFPDASLTHASQSTAGYSCIIRSSACHLLPKNARAPPP